MEDKIGVFICTGYGIGDALDVDALTETISDECDVALVKAVETCEGAGLRAILEEVEREGLNKVCIGGISSRRLLPAPIPEDLIVDRVALREHVVWTQPPNEEDTQMMAEDYLRMYIARLEKTQPKEPFQSEEAIDKGLLVVGGGVTGLSAALDAARAGYEVQLVEKSDQLGGWLARQHRSIPTKPPYRELEDTGIDELVAAVLDHPRIQVHTSSSTASISGGPGLFDVTLASTNGGKGSAEEFRVGAVIQATGWRPADPPDTMPWAELEDVIRNVDLEEIVVEKGRIVRPSDGAEVKSIAFLQCGGVRDAEKHSYCSSICCLNSLKQALYLRESDEEAKAYIFYEFMRTPGQQEDFYRRVQEDPGVFLTRAEVTDISAGAGGKLTITAENTMPGEKIEVEVDLVVLATGMVPNAADGEAIRALEDAKKVAETGESDVQRTEAAKKVERLAAHDGTEILNLQYRQGPDLPSLEYGFPDSHFICFPYESRRTGIYPAGAARQPNDGLGSRQDATGAALKAIQCVEMTSRGEAVHPRAGDQSYPDFMMSRCTQCKRCTEECPFGVLNEEMDGTPLLQATRCRRCGTCMGACPERIISFKDFSVNIVGEMIKAVEVPEEWDEKPRILVIACENDAVPALEALGQKGMKGNPWIRVIPVRCLGSVNTVWCTAAISAGFDGVIMLGCKYGDEYQCHFIEGSELASVREKNVREKLEQMAMDVERVELHQVQIDESWKLPEIFDAFDELIEDIGYNPFKGM